MIGGRIAAPRDGLALDWSVCSRAKHGESESGDAFVLQGNGATLTAAVVDGCGSGPDAAAAARACIDQIVCTDADDLGTLFAACQQRLRGSRGAALAIATIDLSKQTLTWAAVGEIDGVVIRTGQPAARNRASIRQVSGTIGFSCDPVRPVVLHLAAGDAILMITDGVRRTCLGTVPGGVSPAQLARTVVERHSRTPDDALALAMVLDDQP
jgi:negative regulator of sigma-B (phosphoserine phosphatase)